MRTIMKEVIEILPPAEKHPGGQFWVNGLIQSATSGLCGWGEVKPYLYQLRVSDIVHSETNHPRGWKAGDIMCGDVNNEDDYGHYLLVD